MGAKLVGQAFAFAAQHHLLPNEKLLLLWMALKAMDADKPPRYYDSREASAIALGRLVPDASGDDDPRREAIEKERTAAFQRVKIALTGLERKGAIAYYKKGRHGHRAEYVIMLGSGTENVPLQGTENVPATVGKRTRHGRNPYPQGELEQQEQLQEQDQDPASTHLHPVERKIA